MIISQGAADSPEYHHCDDMGEVYIYDSSVIFGCEKKHDSTTIYDSINHAKSIDPLTFIERLRNSPISTLDDMEMANWLLVCCFWGREIVSAPSVKMMFMSAPAELATDLSHLSVLRQKMVEFNEEADDLNGDMLRVQSRRSIMEYMDIRVRRRIMTGCNDPAPYGNLKGMHALAVGGSWSGIMYEWAVARWPDLPQELCPLLDGTAAFTNAVASFHRDAYDSTTNSLDGIYGLGSEDVSHELRGIAASILSSKGSLRVAYLHMFCLNNTGKRYAFWVNLAVMARQPIHVNKSSFAQDFQDIFGPSANQDDHTKMLQIFSDIIDVVSKAFDVLSAKNALLSPEPWKSQMRVINSLFTTTLSNHLEDRCSAMAVTVAVQALLNAVANFKWILPPASDPSRTVLAATNGRGALIET
ncbi:hypothetical protein BGX26_000769 [Mortierella sp. AD094]|nr:hypothetical protein BGX26_000769 [Mortierella sp. AD094]